MKVIPYGRQLIDEDDIAAVVAALRSDWITQGPAIERFERKVAAHCGVKYAVAVANGTAALHIAAAAIELAGPLRVALRGAEDADPERDEDRGHQIGRAHV